ncbi:fas-binding factor 1 [Corvus hawaiiensis]|uniref:fas-binding factor 1 n=1 Tax=Corvus hawaiiensis TaxID=134902 RepID=UPI00201950DC|nr:fas-binding factor 1 [Corvus hawaiiensis]
MVSLMRPEGRTVSSKVDALGPLLGEGRGSRQEKLVVGEYEPPWSEDQLTRWQHGRYHALCVSVAPVASPAAPTVGRRGFPGSPCLQDPIAGRYVTASPCSRCASQNSGKLKADPGSKPPPSARHSIVRETGRTEDDWLTLKDEEILDLEPELPAKSSPAADRKHIPASQIPAAGEAAAKADPLKEEEKEAEEDGLSDALACKKAQAQAEVQERKAQPLETPGKGLDPHSPVRSILEDDFFSRLLEEGIDFVEFTTAEAQFQDPKGCLAVLLHIQTLVSQLERQVWTLEMQRTQQEQLLDFLHQRHQEDLDLITCGYRSQKKVVKNKDRQQEERLQPENEQSTTQFLLKSQGMAPTQEHPKSQEQDKLLKEFQTRLSQQQRDVEEERRQFQMIGKLEARLREQTQLLEQERWKAMVEKAQAESLQRSLEEQQKFMMQQLSMVQEEREKEKRMWLEEKNLMLQKCFEERGKLAAEWAEFHNQQQLMEECLEHKMEQSQKMDFTMMRLAKEQADLKLQGQKLRAKEEQLERDKEQLDESWLELRLKKEKLKRAKQRIQQREKELKGMTERSCQKYEEGEQALWEARWIESEHQEGLRAIQRQMEQLRHHQELLHQDRLSMAQQRRQLEQFCNELSHKNQKILLTEDQGFCAPMDGVSSTQCKTSCVLLMGRDADAGLIQRPPDVLPLRRSQRTHLSHTNSTESSSEDAVEANAASPLPEGTPRLVITSPRLRYCSITPLLLDWGKEIQQNAHESI